MAVIPAPPASRPHQITLTSVKAGVRYQVIELNTGETPGLGMLSPRDKPVVINVKGPSELRSSAVEHLRVKIDGIPFPIPSTITGAMFVALPDTFTSPPGPPPAPVPTPAPKAPAPKAKSAR
ncbi:hypothetical protein EMGBS6_05760 [Opitutia bacterium]|nr:hypothetical protein EMGBS6_05760 [Opitutae bacterium]